MKKLLLIGSNTIHTYNYLELIDGFFDDVLLVTDELREGYSLEHVCVDFSLNLNNLWKTTTKIKQIVKQFKPSIIHVHQANSYAFYTLLAVRRLKIPTILTAWGSDILVTPKVNLLLNRMVKFSLKNANYFTSDSKFMAFEMKKLAPEIKDVLIANFGIGVEIKDLEKENIIFSNRLHKKLYRINKIIEAFHRFCNENNENWHLVIAAIGEETEKLKTLVDKLNLSEKVTFVGWISKEENAKWYAKAKYWVSIPESDATSISLLEAMACSCVPIVSNLPANKEWIEHKRNGWIVEYVNSSFFTEATQHDFQSAIEFNKQLICEHGTKEANRAKFISLYTTILHD
jgi:L-malate glycosyltransferase